MTTVTVLPGDGIGPEVTERALEELPGDWDIVFVDAGAKRFLADGSVLTEADLEAIRDGDALLLGAVGDPRVAPGILEAGILLRLRRELDLYVNLRPFPEIDVVIVRENSEGLYAGRGSDDGTVATEVSVNTAGAVERCARAAFDLAATRTKRLTWVHKTNVLTRAGALWDRAIGLIHGSYPEIEVCYEHVDAAAYHLVGEPGRYDVVFTDNMFGDILSDVAAAVSGGLGRAASANLHPDPTTRSDRCLGLFEPIHGSAPDLVGTGRADPTAAIRAAHMLMDAVSERTEMEVTSP